MLVSHKVKDETVHHHATTAYEVSRMTTFTQNFVHLYFWHSMVKC